MEQEIIDLQSDIVYYRNEVNTLQQFIKELQGDRDKCISNEAQERHKSEVLSLENTKLHRELENYRKRISQLEECHQKDIQSLKEHYQYMQHSTVTQEIKELTVQYEDQKQNYVKQITEQKEQYKLLQEKNDKVQRQLEKELDQKRDFQRELDNCKIENQNMQKTIEKLQSKYGSRRESNLTQEIKIQELTSKVNHLNDEIQDYQKLNSQLEEQYKSILEQYKKDLESEQLNKQKEIEQLKIKGSQTSSETQRSISDLTQKNQQQANEIIKLTEKNDKLTQQLQDNRNQLNQEKQKLSQELESQVKQKQDLQEKIREQNQEFLKIQNQLKQNQEEIEQYQNNQQKQYEEYMENLEQLKTQLENSQNQFQLLQQEKKELEEKIKYFESLEQKQLEQLQQTDRQKEELIEEINNLQHQLKQIQEKNTEYQHLQTHSENQESELENIKKEFQVQLDSNEKLKNQIDNLMQEQQETQNQIQEKEFEIENYQQEVEKLKNEINRLQQQHQNSLEHEQNEKIQLQELVDQYKEKDDQQNQEIERQQKSIIQLQKNNQILNEQLQDSSEYKNLYDDKSKELQMYKEQVKELENINKNLQDDLQNAEIKTNNLSSSLNQKYENQKLQLNALKGQKISDITNQQSLLQQIKQMKDKIQELQQKIINLNNQKEQIEIQSQQRFQEWINKMKLKESNNGQFEAIKSELEEYRSKYFDQEEKNLKTASENRNLQLKIGEIQKEVSAKNEENDKLYELLQIRKQEIEKYLKKIQILQQANNDLSNQIFQLEADILVTKDGREKLERDIQFMKYSRANYNKQLDVVEDQLNYNTENLTKQLQSLEFIKKNLQNYQSNTINSLGQTLQQDQIQNNYDSNQEEQINKKSNDENYFSKMNESLQHKNIQNYMGSNLSQNISSIQNMESQNNYNYDHSELNGFADLAKIQSNISYSQNNNQYYQQQQFGENQNQNNEEFNKISELDKSSQYDTSTIQNKNQKQDKNHQQLQGSNSFQNLPQVNNQFQKQQAMNQNEKKIYKSPQNYRVNKEMPRQQVDEIKNQQYQQFKQELINMSVQPNKNSSPLSYQAKMAQSLMFNNQTFLREKLENTSGQKTNKQQNNKKSDDIQMIAQVLDSNLLIFQQIYEYTFQSKREFQIALQQEGKKLFNSEQFLQKSIQEIQNMAFKMAEKANYYKYRKGEIVFQQGDKAQYFYIVMNGNASAYIKKPKHLIKKMQNQERKLLNIIKEINKQINIYKQEQKQQKVDQMLKKLEEYKKQIDQLQNQEEAFLLDNIPSNSLEKYRTVYKNNINMSDKEQNNEMKIENASSIHNNKVNHEKNNQPIKKDSKIHKKTEIFQENQFQITSKVSQFFKVKTYNQWEHFGEIPFIARNSKHSMTVIADEELEVIYLDKKHFSTIFSEYYRVINFEAFLISQFFIIPGHYNQVKDDILNLSLQFQKQEYRIRDIVFNEGDKADLVYLIKKGQVILTHYQQPQVSNNESRNITKQLVEQGSIKNMNNYTNEKNLDSLINQTTKKKLKRTLEKSRGKILTEGQFFGYEDIFQSNNVEPLRSYEAAANSEKVELLTISQSKLKHFGVSEIQDIFADQIKNQQKFLEPFKRQQEKALQIIENNIRKQITENFLKAQKINQEENNIIKFTEQFQSLPDSANHDKALLPKIQKSVYQKYVEQVRFKNMNNIITRKFFSDDSKETKLTPLQINNIVSQRNYKQKFLLYEGDKQKHINQYQMISEFQQNLNQKPQLSIVDLDKDIQEEQKRAFLLNNQKVLLEYEELFESANVGLLNNLQKLEDKKSKIPFLKDKIEYQKVINKIKEKSDFKQLIQQTYLLNQGNKQFEQLYSEGQQINKFFQDKVYEDLPKRKDILIDFVNKNVIKEVDESNLNDDSSNQYLQQSNFNKYTNINSKQNMSMSYNEYNKIKQKQVGVLLNQYQKEENQITQNQSNKQTNFNKNYNQYFNTTIDTIEMDDQSSAHMLASNQLKGRISFKKNSYIGSDHNLNNYSRKDLRINSVDIQEEEQQLISEMYQNSLAQSQKQLAIQNIIKNESKPLGLQQKKLNNILQSSGNLYQNYKCKGQNAISPQKRPSILQYIQPRNQELNNSYSSHTNLISLQNSKQNINYKVKKKKIGLNQTDRQIYSKLSSQNMNTNIKNIPGIQKVKSKIYGNHQNIQGKIQKSQVSSSENNSNYNMFESSKQISKSNKNLFASQKTNVLDMSDSNRKYFKKIKNVQSNESLNINKSESTNIFNNSSTTQKIYHKYSEDGNWRFLQEIEKQKEITKNAQYFQKQQKLLDSRNDKSQKNLENVTKDFPLQKRRNLDANILQNAQDTIQKQQQQLKDFQYKKLFKQGQTNAKISNIQLQNKNPIYSYSRLKIEQSKTEDKNFFVNKIPPINSQFQLPDKIPSNVSTNKLKKFIDMVAIKKNQQFPQINQGSQQNNLKNQKIQINKKRVFKGLMKKINLPSNISNDNFKNKQHKPLSSVDLEKSNQMAQNKNQNSSSKLKTFCSNLLSPDIFIRTYNLQIQNNNPQNHLQNKSRPVLNTNSCKQIQTNNSKEAISPIQMHSSNQQIIQNKSQNRSSIVNDITQKQNEQIKHNGSQMDLSLRINQQNIDTQSQDNTPKKLMKHLEKKQTNQEISQVQLIQQSENQPLRYNLKIQKIQSDNDEAEFINENNYTSYYGNKDEIEQTQATQTKNYLQININGSQNMNQNMSGNYLQGGSIISHSQLTSKNISPSYKKSSSIKDLKKQLEQNQLEYQLQQQQFQQQKQQQQQQQQQQSFNLSHIFNFNFSSETQNQQNIQFNSNVQTSHLQSQQIQLQDVVEEREEENKSEVSTNKFYIKKQSMSSFQNNMTPTDKMKQLQLENQLNKYQFQQFDHDYRNFDKQHVNLNQNNNEINDDDLIEKISQIQSSSSLSSKSHNSKSDSDLEQLQQSLEFGFSQVDMKQQNKQQQNLNEKNNDEILIQIDKGSENNSNLISNENRINNKSIKLQQDLTNVNNNISTSYKNTNKLVVNNSYYEYQDASSFFNIAPQQSEK